MDRTVLYREIVRLALDGEQVLPPEQAAEPDSVTQEASAVAKQVARVTAMLRQVRPRYLALAGPQQLSDAAKDDLDYTVRQVLQREQRKVRALERKEEERQATAKPTGFAAKWLSSPEAAAASETLAAHRRGMFFYLNQQLQAASLALGEMQRVRLARSAQRNPHARPVSKRPQAASNPPLSVSTGDGDSLESESPTKARLEPGAEGVETSEPTVAAPPVPESANGQAEGSSMRLMMEEHDELLEELNATLEKAQRAESSLREIAELQSELNQHLASQSQQLDTLTTDVFRTTTDISGANTQLEQARRSSRRASRFVIASSLATGVFLLLLNGK